MPKSKSSASSATKKKQARKAEKREERKGKEVEDIEEIDSENENGDAQDPTASSADVVGEANDVDVQRDGTAAATTTTTTNEATVQDVTSNDTVASNAPSKPAPTPQLRDRRGKQLKEQVPLQGKQRGEKKAKTKQNKKHKKGEAPPPPRKKQYIPPPKPPRGNVDPVDTYGLGVTGTGFERVSAERVVTLRLLNKKDAISVERAMDELLGWITSIRSDDHQPQEDFEQVSEMLPVWIHHFPRLSSHVSRRVRLSTANLHAHLLHKGPQALLDYTLPVLNAPATLEHEDYLSSLLCAAFDPDRQTRTAATKNWQVLQQEHINPGDYLREIIQSLNSTVLENSTDSTAPLSHSKLAKMDDDARISIQEEQDRQSNQLAASIDAFTYLFDRMSEDTAELFEPILSSDRFWSLLSASVVEAAPVRRAVWRSLGRAITTSAATDILEENLRTISRSAVLSGFSERDMNTQTTLFEVLVSLLRKYTQAWKLSSSDARRTEDGGDDASSSTSNEEEDENTATEDDGEASNNASQTILKSIQALLNLLQLGFYGNATSGYQALPQLLQTLPSALFRANRVNLELLFSSFWAALTGRALDAAGTQGLTAYTSCLADLVEQYAGRLTQPEDASILSEQLQRMWEYYLGVLPSPSRSSSLARPATITALIQALVALEDKQPGTLDTIWPSFSSSAMSIFEKDITKLPMLSSGIVALLESPSDALTAKARELELAAIQLAVRNLALPDQSSLVKVLLRKDSQSIFADQAVAQALDSAVAQLSLSSFDLTQTYLRLRSSPTHEQAVWKSLCRNLGQAIPSSGLSVLLQMVNATGDLPSGLPNAILDSHIEKALEAMLDSSEVVLHDVKALASVVNSPSLFATSSLPAAIIARTATHLDNQISHALRAGAFNQISIALCLQILLEINVELLQTTPTDSPVAALAFEAAYLLGLDASHAAVATDLWQRLSGSSHSLPSRDLAALIGARLGSYLLDEQCLASPFTLVDAMSKLETLPEVLTVDLWSSFLPDEEIVSRLSSQVYESSIPSVLSIVEPLVPLETGEALSDPVTREVQVQPFLRAALAWTAVLTNRRSLVPMNVWFLPFSLLLLEHANDRAALNDSTRIPQSDLSALIAISERLSAYMSSQISTSFAVDWHTVATQALRKQQYSGTDPATIVLSRNLDDLMEKPSAYRSRVLSKSLSMFLRYSDATSADAERWLALAQSCQTSNFAACLAIVMASREYLYDSPRFQRYQSEIANDLSGLRPTQANEKGIPLLRLLIAVAPPATSERELLPVNRAMFLVQTLQKWLTVDDDGFELEDEVHTLLVQLFTFLVPIIQNLSGTHWDTIFDLLESNIETASWTDVSSVPGLWATCSLLREIRDRAAMNREFGKLVRKPYTRALKLLQGVFAGAAQLPQNGPALRTLEAVSDLVANGEDIELDNLPAILRIMSRASGPAQIAAYYLSRRAIKKATDSLVLLVETRRAQEDEAMPDIALPADLLSLVSDSQTISATSVNVGTTLLAWLLIFQHFEDITTVVKSSYIEQLRRQDLVGQSLLPAVFGLAGVTERGRGSDISPWAIEEYNLDASASSAIMTSEESAHLAAHVYYRALQTVPSLIRAEWEGYKNKQYSMATSSFTSKYFSPVLIEKEMNRVREEEAKDTLQDENLTIKILPNVNEVKATYIVDEQPMEISVRIPPDFPLVGVEVKEGKRVGVPEATWRAWLLNVQLVISTQNGSIADALALFKANASRHFEGVEACAICYSVISVTDRSMPTKRCRTCKQLFHPSCLYKWFSTSHGSSCPLCRSLF